MNMTDTRFAAPRYCARRNPRFSLDNSQGAVDRLTFHYDQEHRHLGTGYNDYRMTFSGDMADVQAAIRNITVEFPWLDTAYDGSEYIPPWPFKSWYTCPSAHVLACDDRDLTWGCARQIRIQDLHSEYAYDMIEHRLWYVPASSSVLSGYAAQLSRDVQSWRLGRLMAHDFSPRERER
eukprot:1706591-Rhodomonas_salina.1